MIKYIKSLFVKKHKWQTTHTNGWQHSTKEKCINCGVTREIESSRSSLMVKWVYSDSTESKEFNHFSKETTIKII